MDLAYPFINNPAVTPVPKAIPNNPVDDVDELASAAIHDPPLFR